MAERLKVGDVGEVIYNGPYSTYQTTNSRMKPRAGVVVKTGRKWATVESSDGHGYGLGRYDMDTGRIDNGGFGSADYLFLTPPMAEERQAVLNARAVIKAHGLRLEGPSNRWDASCIIALAEWLQEQIDCIDA